jgi:hypothetical protein
MNSALRIVFVLVAILSATAVRATQFARPRLLLIDSLEAVQDTVPPDRPYLTLNSIYRGWTHQKIPLSDSLYSGTFSNTRGVLKFVITVTKDDRTTEAELGYLFVHISGELPRGLELPTRPICTPRPVRGPVGWDIPLEWDDGSDVPQDPFDFEVAVVAVDKGGNKSPRSNTVRVIHDGLCNATFWDSRWR